MNAFLIAGTASGVGKTTVSLALMAAFCQTGKVVQAFKCGPDFLDTGHHSRICNRPSRNLDTWMLSKETNRTLFHQASGGADIAIVEGMMGLFDGVSGGGEEGSAAQIAKLLDIPVVLVVDASKSGRSIAALIKGFLSFDPDLRFAGLVLNGVGSKGHFHLLEPAIRSICDIPILGWLPRTENVTIPERHLGLHTAEEFESWDERRQELASFAETNLNLEQLLQFSQISSWHQDDFHNLPQPRAPRVRLGVARDQAFSFYYQDSLDLLESLGADIVPFSPLADHQLPPDLDALYLGGGYPELFAEKLSANRSMIEDLQHFAHLEKPIYAECGGMIYLSESLTTTTGTSFPLAGLLPLAISMTDRLVRFGYVEIELVTDCLFGQSGEVIRGHSFHYSNCTPSKEIDSLYRVKYTLSGREEVEGFRSGSVLGSYLHLHFLSNPSFAESFLAQARLKMEVPRS